MKPTANTPEVPTKQANANAKAPEADKKKTDRFAHQDGDKQIVNGIGDTADEENERHTAPEHNKDSRTRE